jgi:hypothetical protein
MLRVEDSAAAAFLRQFGIQYANYRGLVAATEAEVPLPPQLRAPGKTAAPSVAQAADRLQTLIGQAAGQLSKESEGSISAAVGTQIVDAQGRAGGTSSTGRRRTNSGSRAL